MGLAELERAGSDDEGRARGSISGPRGEALSRPLAAATQLAVPFARSARGAAGVSESRAVCGECWQQLVCCCLVELAASATAAPTPSSCLCPRTSRQPLLGVPLPAVGSVCRHGFRSFSANRRRVSAWCRSTRFRVPFRTQVSNACSNQTHAAAPLVRSRRPLLGPLSCEPARPAVALLLPAVLLSQAPHQWLSLL